MAESATRIRLVRRSMGADKLRAYRVLIDGQDAGRIQYEGALCISVSPGPHTIHLEIDWCKSNSVAFTAKEGEEIAFECGCSLTGWRTLFALIYVTVLSDEYLWIRQLD